MKSCQRYLIEVEKALFFLKEQAQFNILKLSCKQSTSARGSEEKTFQTLYFYSPEPRTEVSCLQLNLRISKLAYSYRIEIVLFSTPPQVYKSLQYLTRGLLIYRICFLAAEKRREIFPPFFNRFAVAPASREETVEKQSQLCGVLIFMFPFS